MKSLGNFPDPFIAEISGQPGALRRAATSVRDQAGGLEAVALAAPDRAVVFTGMGSSYDACYPAVADLARAGHAAVMVDSAELLHFRMGMLGSRTLLVAVSQSGESAETVRVVQDLPASRPVVVSITNGRANPLASSADITLDTAAGIETGPSTMTFAASLVVIGAVARAIVGEPIHEVTGWVSEITQHAGVAIDRLLSDPGLPDALVTWLGERDAAVILGRGPARAAAEMGALTIKEAVGMPVESLQTAQFRHGPLELAGPGLAAMLIATEPETIALDLGLARELVNTGASVCLVTEQEAALEGTTCLEIGTLDSAVRPAASILPAQLLAWRLSTLRGREPGAYHRASKVTTHE